MQIHRRKTKKYLSQQQLLFKKNGWIQHLILNEDPSHYPAGINIHTHGLSTNFNHRDIQICLPIRPELASSILAQMVENIKAGTKYEPGNSYEGVLSGGYKIGIINSVESGRAVLRVIIPDENGTLEDPRYANQLTLIRPPLP
ncbi:DUF4262 domain-containing protein [Chitinophaga sp. CC14]|uniref:DUF4262 domain-containing protein n=1 Tax=Chitinophaga sp. CC14 TaxID=3029199 RepID=UPI003B7947AB